MFDTISSSGGEQPFDDHMFVEQAFQVKHLTRIPPGLQWEYCKPGISRTKSFQIHFVSHPVWRMVTMAMLPEINVLAHPTADAPRLSLIKGGLGSGYAPNSPSIPMATSAGQRALPTSHYVAPVAKTRSAQPNFMLRRLGVVAAVIATTIVSVVGMGSAGADQSIDAPVAVEDSTASPEVAGETAGERAEEPAVEIVVVQPGDTLWTIAERVAPTVDRRKAVDQLAKIAGGSMLEVGQRLEIPAIFG